MVCPVCGKKSEYLQCPQCGFDMSRDYEGYPTLNPLKEGLPSREIFGNGIKNLVRCGNCGGLSFRVDSDAGKLYCCNCGAESDLQIHVPGNQGHISPGENEKSWKKNVLRSDVCDAGWAGKNAEYPVFGSLYRRKVICSITFLKSLAEVPKNAWDVSESGDGGVMAWVIPNGELYDLYIGAEGGICAGESCRSLFDGYINVQRILNLDFLHTEKVQNMSCMFHDCKSLTILDLSSFDTSNVQDMSFMFCGCQSLSSLDLRSFDTSNVQDMSAMFYNCSSLTSLDLSSFDMSNVQYRTFMFQNVPRAATGSIF